MAKQEEILELKSRIDKVADYIAEELNQSQSEVAWVLLDALAAHQFTLVAADWNVASFTFMEDLSV